jgi:hypothetical protein
MATVLERPPTRPEEVVKQPPDAPEAPDASIVAPLGGEAASPPYRQGQSSVHDHIAALLLGLGEWGALAHGAFWEALLGRLADHGKDAEPPAPHAPHQTPHAGPLQ